ncbi:MAG TPA: NAD(P)/FAD-dependent oxidoreductase [Planctomycetota bacterium]|nr:NAD(P)/FAD-dependent oxidoreductase [Planctomycetota bacterium]
MYSEIIDVAVIGAGGAGFLAAIAAARAGAKTVLFERMKTPAKKIVISGGGRCNFSNTLDARKFVRLFGDKNASKLGNALRAFSNDDLIALLKNYGVEGQVERNYRLYTKSGRGADVVKALSAELQRAGGTLELQARITRIQKPTAENGADVFELHGSFHEIEGVRRAKCVIVCTGGLSYPVTGSTGDGYAWAREFGHCVTPLRAALVGLTAAEPWTKSLQGLAWPDAHVSLWPNSPLQGKPLNVERAEILFTHFGISGPAILDTSNAFVASGLPKATLTIDYFPDEPREKLDARLLERFKQFPNRSPARALEGLMPVRLLDHFEQQLGADGQTAVCRLPKTARLKLLDLLKSTRLTVTGTRGMEFGEVTAGGVEWDQIDPATMESKLTPGLFFAGEILDLAGRCGGFNLQAAFSTGYLAGECAAKKIVAR